MTDIHIPPEALEKGARAVHEMDREASADNEWPVWDELTPRIKEWRLKRAAAAFRAIVEGWEGIRFMGADDSVIYLPLPLEAPNPTFTSGHCPHKKAPGGCQLHNLQCGYPECDRRLLPLGASNG